MKRKIKNLCLFLVKITLIAYHKLKGPPKILSYNTTSNVALLRAFGAKVGSNIHFNAPVVLYHSGKGFANLHIGDNCVIHSNTYLDLTESITLEKGVSLGPGTTIMTHNRYNFNPYLEKHLAHTCGRKPVHIKAGSGIKAGALITMGITIGENAVVAGHAVVNRDVASGTFVGGVPARVISNIDSQGSME